MSDITLEPIHQESDSSRSFDPLGSWQGYPHNAERAEPERVQHTQTRPRDGEARWQDDLDRWKSRRRNVTSDLHKKNEERLSGVGGADCWNTVPHRGVQEESEREGVLLFARQQQPQGPSTALGLSGRSMPLSQPLVPREDPRPGSLASDEAFAPSEVSHLASSCPTPRFVSSAVTSTVSPAPDDGALTPASPPENGACPLTNDTAGGGAPTEPLLTNQTEGASAVFFSPPEASDPMETSPTDCQRPVPAPRAKPLQGAPSARSHVSASLPRGFRRSEAGSRLSMGVTPRPFQAKPSRVASLPRFYSMDESYSGLAKSGRERPRLPPSFTSPEKAPAPATECHAPSCVPRDGQRRRKEEGEGGEAKDSAPNVHSFVVASVVATAPHTAASPPSPGRAGRLEVGYSDMRVSLHQKPSSGRDFGFQADWDSTGARIRSVQPGSPAQLCHLQAGDEIACVGGRHVAEMSYEQWKACMDAALREGKLLMDVRRRGQNGWSSGASSLPFKSHKTIDLTSADSVLVAGPECQVPDAGGPTPPLGKLAEEQVNGHPANGLPVKAKNGHFTDGPVLPRNEGGSESAISDLQVPSIGTSASRWSWDTEEERKRQEKWQMEQERLLQEKYRRDQERLEEAWRKAQEEAGTLEGGGLEGTPLSNGNATPFTPPPFFGQSDSRTFAVSNQHAAEVGPVQSRQVPKQPAAGHQAMEECDSPTKTSQWKKSKSTPSLDSSRRQDSRASGKKKGRPSQAEQDRLQILAEMRKKTPLHTDSSWIRQQSPCSVSKEHVTVAPITVAPITRHDSLENQPPSSRGRPLSRNLSSRCSLGSAAPYRGYSSRCSLGPDAAIFSTSLRQRSASASPTQPIVPGAEDTPPSSQQRSSASAASVTWAGTPRPALRCGCDAGSSSATAATADSESVPVSPCEQDGDHREELPGSAPSTTAVSTT